MVSEDRTILCGRGGVARYVSGSGIMSHIGRRGLLPARQCRLSKDTTREDRHTPAYNKILAEYATI